MGMFAAYFDESGTTRESRVLVVAGYVSPVEQWKKFESEWWHTLANAGLDPNHIAFHLSEFESRKLDHMKAKTPFAEWSDRKAEAVYETLLGIMRTRIRFGVAIGLIVDDYEQWASDGYTTLSRYAFCAIRCIHRVAASMDQLGLQDEIAYIFGDGAPGSEEVNRSVAGVLANPEWRKEYRMASLGFGGTLKYLPLQAADIGVWETRRYCMTARNNPNEAGLRKSLEFLHKAIPHPSEYYDRAGLENYLKEFAERHAEEAREVEVKKNL